MRTHGTVIRRPVGRLRWRALVVLTASAIFALAACSGPPQSDSDPAPKPAERSTTQRAEPKTLAFTGTTVDGQKFEGAALAGKPAVLWFWAPWCPTCRAQIPNIVELSQHHAGKVSFVGVGGLATREMIVDLAEELPDFTQLVDPEGTVWNHFRVEAQSTFTVIDGTGKIVSEGYLEDADLNELVAKIAG